MKIPKKLKVGGVVYTVEMASNLLEDSGRTVAGKHSPKQARIVLSAENTKDYMGEAFLHEIVHAIEARTGFELSEPQIDTLCGYLYQVLKDNKLKFYEEKK